MDKKYRFKNARKQIIYFFIVLLQLFCLNLSFSNDAEVLNIDKITISATSELPKVLYIFNWKEPGSMPDLNEGTKDFTDTLYEFLHPEDHRFEFNFREESNF